MALSNLRCTGRQELCCSQKTLAPLNTMRVFWMFGVENFSLDAFSELWSLFRIVAFYWQDRAGRRWTGTVGQRRKNGWFTHTTNQINREGLNAHSIPQTFFNAFSNLCCGASVVATLSNIQCWISSKSIAIFWIFRVPFSVFAHLKQWTEYQKFGVTRTLFKTVVAFSPAV